MRAIRTILSILVALACTFMELDHVQAGACCIPVSDLCFDVGKSGGRTCALCLDGRAHVVLETGEGVTE